MFSKMQFLYILQLCLWMDTVNVFDVMINDSARVKSGHFSSNVSAYFAHAKDANNGASNATADKIVRHPRSPFASGNLQKKND